MSDYISREAAIKRFTFATLDCLGMEPTIRASDVVLALQSIPAADVRPVVRGKWTISEHEYLDCSVCGYSFYTGFDTMREAKEYLESGYTPNFCPNCGADMREES